MVIGLLKEKEGETRVSLLRDVVVSLMKKNQVWFEAGAGVLAYESDAHYTDTGAILKTRDEILSQADIILSIKLLNESDLSKVKSGCVAIGVYQPLFNFKQLSKWAEKNITTFS